MHIRSFIPTLLLTLFVSGTACTQPDDLEVPDTLVATKKRPLEVPPFYAHLPDTVQHGENDLIIHDSYTALGREYVYDALHAFNRRRMDHFGGLLNEKINAGLAEVRNRGFNSDLKKLIIQIDPSTLTVYWTAVVGPSEDGNCYTHIDSRGSAGGGLKAVEKQLPRMHSLHNGLVPQPLLEFNENVLQCYDWHGNKLDTVYTTINIRQHFYKYSDPRIGSTVSPAASIPREGTNESATSVAVTAPQKKAPAAHKKYTVRQGDTLSEIAQKHHTTITNIKQLNGLRSDRIQVGQVLKMP